jgi:hypothetical protein
LIARESFFFNILVSILENISCCLIMKFCLLDYT